MLVRSAVLCFALVTSASAAKFYIVQDTQKQSCVISQEAPKGEGQTIVGDGAYGDEAVAASDMSKMLACNPRDATTGVPQRPTGLKTQP